MQTSGQPLELLLFTTDGDQARIAQEAGVDGQINSDSLQGLTRSRSMVSMPIIIRFNPPVSRQRAKSSMRCAPARNAPCSSCRPRQTKSSNAKNVLEGTRDRSSRSSIKTTPPALCAVGMPIGRRQISALIA